MAGRKLEKAPGPDGIGTEAVVIAYREAPELVVGAMNELAQEGSFPAVWKRAKLVLLWKGRGDLSLAGSFRPICLIDTMAKVFEAIIKHRLEAEIAIKAPISDRQFGFKKGTSTMHAHNFIKGWIKEGYYPKAAIITLDIRNAFNSASLPKIMEELVRREISGGLRKLIASYFKERKIIIENGVEMDVTGYRRARCWGLRYGTFYTMVCLG